MCCIYATLFAVVIYFCPRLINLMRPSLQRHRGLAVRLIVATSVCILIFGIHCINYARLVIAPPRKVYWWYQYGSYYDTTCAIFPVCKHRVETYISYFKIGILLFQIMFLCYRSLRIDTSHYFFVYNAPTNESSGSFVQSNTRNTTPSFNSIGLRSDPCRFESSSTGIRRRIEQQQQQSHTTRYAPCVTTQGKYGIRSSNNREQRSIYEDIMALSLI